MKSTNQDIYKRQQLTKPGQRESFRKRLRWFATLIASIALCAAATAPLAAQGKKTPRFVDNGDGTVTDNRTGLIWEKKTDSNVNDTYTWSSTGMAPDGKPLPDGTLFTSFLATMRCDISADGSCGLAGYYDWRIPNISELRTIVDCSKPNCLDPIFGPTPASSFYWSASAVSPTPTYYIWGVSFPDGGLGQDIFHNFDSVRAVRGGR